MRFSFAVLPCLFLGSVFAAPPSLDPPKLRLGDAVAPTGYSVELTLVPDREVFQGVMVISVDVRTPSQIIWLNATHLAISAATFQPETGAAEKASVVPGGDDYTGFAFDRPVAGKGVLHIAYQGKI